MCSDYKRKDLRLVVLYSKPVNLACILLPLSKNFTLESKLPPHTEEKNRKIFIESSYPVCNDFTYYQIALEKSCFRGRLTSL